MGILEGQRVTTTTAKKGTRYQSNILHARKHTQGRIGGVLPVRCGLVKTAKPARTNEGNMHMKSLMSRGIDHVSVLSSV